MNAVQAICQKPLLFYGLVESEKELTVHERATLEPEVNVALLELQQLSTHLHISAFSNIWFGENPNGIYGTTPTDLMHAFLQGIIPYVI